MMKPIPINGGIIPTNTTISPNKKYTACIIKSFFSLKLTIVNNNKIYSANDKPKHFQHNLSTRTKIHSMLFNNNSDKLYCLTEKKQYSELHSFNLAEDSTVDNKWIKQQPIALPCEASCFSIDDITNKLSIIGFQNQTIINKTIDTKTSLIDTKDMPDAITDITQISFDAKNMHIYACMQNKALLIFSEEDNIWTIKYNIDNCPDLPNCYSNDGNTLFFTNNSILQIRSLLPAYNGEIEKEIDFNKDKKYKQLAIKDICINTIDNKVTLFLRSTEQFNNILFSFRLEKTGSQWLCIETVSFNLYAGIALANPYLDKIVSFYIDETNTVVLVNYNYIHFFRGKPRAELKIANREKLKYLTDIIRAENIRQFEFERRRELENQSSTSSRSNGLFMAIAESFSEGSSTSYNSSSNYDE